MTIVDGGRYLRDFLLAVMALEDPPPLEIIVPFDASIADTKSLGHEFPHVTFLNIGVIAPTRSMHPSAEQHELYDRRRSCGLAVAAGEIVATLEDRGHPSLDWASTLVRLHAEVKRNVIGGAIECDEANLLHWAFYVTDFGRYGRPFASGPATWVSDANVSYTRKALAETRHLWSEHFDEMIVHRFLMSKGEELYLSNELVVNHTRPPVTLRKLLRERVEWGVLFGYARSKQFSAVERLLFIAGSPLIAPGLWIRHGVIQAQKGRGVRYLKALPYVILLTTAWTLGEVWGYIKGRP